MIAGCKENNVILQIGFMKRFDKAFLSARKHIREGRIGRMCIIKSTWRGPGLPPKWALDFKNAWDARRSEQSRPRLHKMAGRSRFRVYAEADTFKCFELKKHYPHISTIIPSYPFD